MELCLVQILVVVAIIQMGTLKAEVEKGSMTTAIDHGLLEPKARRKRLRRDFSLVAEREWSSYSPSRNVELSGNT